ncbi:MAG: protein kinase [Acidimicrobiales bacterium]
MTLDRERVTAALPAYEVGAELGRGGWGVVLEGRHRQLGREVAIKQLPRAFAADPAVRERFTAEARLLASLDHPHIVPVYDYVESDGLCLLVMEKLPGGTVWSRFTSSGVTAEAACGLVLATAAGLHAAHQRGILHRDVKPENLMFSAGGALKVTDFGIAKVVGGAETMATRAGEVLGTPAYMAPEQAQAAELGPATDVYAVGIMLYELLSGRLPFPDEGDAMAILYQHVHEQPSPLTEVAPGVPAGVAAVVMRALATRPDQRYPTAEAFGVALAEAATSAWGPGWPAARGQVSVMGSTLIVAATERQSVPPIGAGAGLVASTGSAPPTVVVAPSAPVRATVTTRPGRARPLEDDGVVLVAVRRMVERPPFPTRQVAWTAGLLSACLALGLLGLGSPGHGGDLPQGAVRVAGVDAAAGAVALDLADVVIVEGRLPGGVPDQVRLALSIGGIGVGSASGTTELGADGSFRAVVDLAGSRYVAAGRTTGQLDLLSGGRSVGSRSFAVRSTRSGPLSLPGAVGIAALLFLVAYAESVLRLLRRGRRRRTGVATLVLLGGPLGCAVALVAALLAGREPGLLTMVLAGLAGGGAGLAAGRAGVSVGRFRRLARAKVSR